VRLLPAIRRKQDIERADPFISLQEWAGLLTQFAYQGSQFTIVGQSQEEIAPNYSGIAQLAYKTDPIVFACVTVRQLLLSEARFAFRQRRNGRPGNLFTTAALKALEAPWPGATTGDLISRMELDASLAGNWFGTNRYGGVRTLRPDWVTLVVGSDEDSDVAIGDPEAEVVGYVYHPGGRGGGKDPIAFLPDEVAHYAPHPDPVAHFRGMSWITSVIRDIMADKAYTDHKLSFMENAGTPNLHVSVDVPDLDAYEAFVAKFREKHEGVGNAYKTLFTTRAVEVSAVGADFKQMDFKVTQGAGETRIAAAARTPPVLVGLSEGLQGSSLNAGNFEASMKSFADMFARPEWRNMAGSLARIVPPPPGSELWYDDRDIPALKEDIRVAGERLQAETASIASLVSTSGFTPESSVDAVTSGDLSRLVHSGLIPVQQQQPSNGKQPPVEAKPLGNGSNGARRDDLLGEMLQLGYAREARRPVEIHNHMPELEPPHVEFHEGAFTSHTTVEAAEPSRVEIAEGAFRVDSPVTVEPAQVDVHNHLPVQEPPRVDIHEGAFRSETTVQPAEVTVEAAQITVEPARIEAGAVEVHVDAAPPAEPPVVNVNVEQPAPKGKRRVEFGDGRGATVTDEDGVKTVEFDDGRTAIVKDDG
jgi:hypothetical protein